MRGFPIDAAKIRVFFVLTLIGAALFPLAAQEADEGEGNNEGEIPIESDWSGLNTELYARGDKIFSISLGTTIPLFFLGDIGNTNNIKVGGTLSLAYTYFFNSHIFFGGELGGMFAQTLSTNYLFMVPMGLRTGYQFIAGRIEIPLSLMVGFAPQKYLEYGYFGLFMKPMAALTWRYNPDWSFGINTAWWWVPQWTEKSVDGNFLEITLTARYHF